MLSATIKDLSRKYLFFGKLKNFGLKRKNNRISIDFCYNNTIKGLFIKFRVATKHGMSFNSVNKLL